MQRVSSEVGIDALAVYVPRLYVDLTKEWARARASALADGDVQKLVGKVTTGVGVRKMAVPDAHEDAATLAAMAAVRVIDGAGIDPRDVDFLAIGTETTVDQSKSMAAYVLGMLERRYGVRLDHVGAPQLQFACIGATYALEAAVSRIRAGENTKRYALVIATDISRYPLASAGELTQGAGAVAMLVAERPRLLALDPGATGTITRDERDFFRPNWTQTAVVDGKYSVDVYLDCVEAAFRAYERRAPAGAALYDDAAAFLFHVPFPRMAEYAALRVFSHLWMQDPEHRERLVAAVPAARGLEGPVQGAARREIERALAATPLFREAFAAKVAPSLVHARDIGNMYSGSLYLALASLLEQWRGEAIAGRRVVLASYGSGASAKVLSGVIAAEAPGMVERLGVARELTPAAEGGRRVPLSLADYERLHGASDTELDLPDGIASKLDAGAPLDGAEVTALADALRAARRRVRPRGPSVVPPRGEFALERIGTSEAAAHTDVGYRYYAWVGEP